MFPRPIVDPIEANMNDVLLSQISRIGNYI